MRYILGPSSGGRGARGNRTPAGPALFSVTPTFLPHSACRRPATSAAATAATTAASATDGLTLFLWGASGAQRGVSCNAQGVCWPVIVPRRLQTHCCSKEDALMIKNQLGERLPCLYTSYLVVASEEFHFANAPVLRSGLNSF